MIFAGWNLPGLLSISAPSLYLSSLLMADHVIGLHGQWSLKPLGNDSISCVAVASNARRTRQQTYFGKMGSRRTSTGQCALFTALLEGQFSADSPYNPVQK